VHRVGAVGFLHYGNRCQLGPVIEVGHRGRYMSISPLSLDIAYFALMILGDAATILAGGIIALAFVDGLLSVIQLIRG
jgi:hypothetical protein